MTDIRVPSLPESVAEATVLDWHKQPGDSVTAGETIVDLETDKIVLEVPAPATGVLTEILAPSGTVVSSQTPLARLDGATPPKPEPESKPAPPPQPPQAEPRLAPAARRLVKALDLDPQTITGSGKDGRIHKADVVAWLDEHEQTQPPADPDSVPLLTPAVQRVPSASPKRGERRQPISRLRARIAERMLQAQQQTATLTTFTDVDMSAIQGLRARYQDSFERTHGVRLGFMSFFVKAAVHGLQRFPVINATLDDHEIVYYDHVDIGVAIAAERGLVVPIVRHCEQLDLASVERQIVELRDKANAGSLTLDELTGGTFSITNGGVFGSLLSTPLLNPPQSAILGMHRIEKRPVVRDDQIVIRPMMYLALSYDHRLIDGREAVQFLATMKEALEDPARLLLRI